MIEKEVYVGDIGTSLELLVKNSTVVMPLASTDGLTGKSIIFKKPSGTVMTTTAAYLTNGADGIIRFVTTASTDLNEAGQYQAQGLVVFGTTGSWHTKPVTFEVYSNLG